MVCFDAQILLHHRGVLIAGLFYTHIRYFILLIGLAPVVPLNTENKIIELARMVGMSLKERGWLLATAESCTGGGIAQSITEIPGSSAWFDRGFVTYSNVAKIQMLGVKSETLEKYGAVSFETAQEMTAGALSGSQADWTIAVTGIAGPDGGTMTKPVGTVFIAWQRRGAIAKVAEMHFGGDRHQIRTETVKTALAGWLNIDKQHGGEV